MKKYVFTLITLFLICCISSCNKYSKEKMLDELCSDDISNITILALKTGSMTTVTDSANIEKILETVKSLPLYIKSDISNTYNVELVQYTIQKRTGKKITLDVLKPWIAYNNVWYACDSSTCSQLSNMALEYLPN
ncbi:MAG: hypothetical protein PUC65_13640 [Clostridiales bacterium]|nr:hypothetical protein [Clostridiales bacterium]